MIAELLERLRGAAPAASPAPEVARSLDEWLTGRGGRGWVVTGGAHGFWAHFTSRSTGRTHAWIPIIEGTVLGLPRGVAAATALSLGFTFYRHGPAFWNDLRDWLSPPPPDSDPDPERFLVVFDGQTDDVGPAFQLADTPLDPNVALVLTVPDGAPDRRGPTWSLDAAPLTVDLPRPDPAERASLDLIASPTLPAIQRLCARDWLAARLATDPDGALFDLTAIRLAVYERMVVAPEETVALLHEWTRAALLEGSVLDRIGQSLPCTSPPMNWPDPRAAAALRAYDLRRSGPVPPAPKAMAKPAAKRQLEALSDAAYPHHRLSGTWAAAGQYPDLRPQAAAMIAQQSPITRAWLVIENPEASLALLGAAAVERIIAETEDATIATRAACASLPCLPADRAAEWAKRAYGRWPGVDTMAIVAALPWLDRPAQARILRARYEVTERWSISNDRGALTLEEMLQRDRHHWSAVLDENALPHLERAVAETAAELDAT